VQCACIADNLIVDILLSAEILHNHSVIVMHGTLVNVQRNWLEHLAYCNADI